MSKICMLFAMPEEAFPYYEWLLNHNNRIAGHTVTVAVTGIGKNNAARGVAKAAMEGYDIIVNIGTCGSTMKRKGKVFIPTHFYDGDFDLSAFGNYTKDPCGINTTEPDEDSIPLYTYSRFVTDSPENRLVDMEGYIIKAVANILGIPSYIFKIVSDEANGEHVEDFDDVANNVSKDAVTEIMEYLYEALGGEDDAQISFF